MSLRGSSLRTPGNVSSKRKSGYTLLELMIVVVITGVLAAVAIPAFRSYLMKARTAEATNFLGVIKLRQEAYRAEFGAYASIQANMASAVFVPAGANVIVGGGTFAWPVPAGDPFDAIGAQPDSANVRFGYGVAAGDPSQANGLNGGTNLTIAPYNLPANQLDFYFIAQAVADFDDDGRAMTFELTSFSREMWTSDSGKGWTDTARGLLLCTPPMRVCDEASRQSQRARSPKKGARVCSAHARAAQ